MLAVKKDFRCQIDSPEAPAEYRVYAAHYENPPSAGDQPGHRQARIVRQSGIAAQDFPASRITARRWRPLSFRRGQIGEKIGAGIE